MLCRLCLTNCDNYLHIFNESKTEIIFNTAATIMKYFCIEVLQEDTVSQFICKNCWQQIYDFHAFCLDIQNKQTALQTEFHLHIKKEQNDLINNNNAKTQAEINTNLLVNVEEDLKNIDALLCEPEITANVTDIDSAETTEEFAEAADVTSLLELEETTLKVQIKNLQSRPIKKRERLKRVTRQTLKAEAKLPLKCTRSGKVYKTKNQQRTAKEIESNIETENKRETIRELDAYIAEHAKLTCCLCAQPLENFVAMKHHFRKVHQCLGYVLCCNNRYIKRTLYVDHLKWHNNPDIFKCTQCDKVLASRGCYYNHMATVHPNEGELKFECTFCARKFARQYILDYHVRCHQTTGKQHKCDDCDKRFANLYELKAHHKRVHLNGSAVMCDICGKNFKSKQNFLVHKESVHQNAQAPGVQCKVCGRWLKSSRSLYKHMYKHQDEASGKEFVCPTCGTVKPTRQTLNSHIRYHHSDKSFQCTMCDKAFKRSRSLQEHIATHTGQDLYTCPFCPQTFKSHGNMHNHKKKMHPNEWVRKYTQPNTTNTNMEKHEHFD